VKYCVSEKEELYEKKHSLHEEKNEIRRKPLMTAFEGKDKAYTDINYYNEEIVISNFISFKSYT